LRTGYGTAEEMMLKVAVASNIKQDKQINNNY
jgi:hypothetical protein